MSKNNILRPQAGAQEQFMNIPPEVPLVFYGGAKKPSGSTLKNPAKSVEVL